MSSVYDRLLDVIAEKRTAFVVVVDPDRVDLDQLEELAGQIEEGGADAVLVGTSLMLNHSMSSVVQKLKETVQLPIVLFPGDEFQVDPRADAILFLSLISGRNPELLIGKHVRVAYMLKAYQLESIPVGYMLIESPGLSSVQFMSGTMPIPRHKPDIAIAHALAGEYLGMKMIYLEGGSGSPEPIPTEMVHAVKQQISVPLIVSGGIRTPEQAAEIAEAGADVIVIGSRLESGATLERVRRYAAAIHHANPLEATPAQPALVGEPVPHSVA